MNNQLITVTKWRARRNEQWLCLEGTPEQTRVLAEDIICPDPDQVLKFEVAAISQEEFEELGEFEG